MQVSWMAELSGRRPIEKRARRIALVRSFDYPTNEVDPHGMLRNIEWINDRVWPGFPCRERYCLSHDAARDLKSPVAIRYPTLHEEYNP